MLKEKGQLFSCACRVDATFSIFLIDIYAVKYYVNQIAAGWSSLVARRAHNPKVVGSNPAPATNNDIKGLAETGWPFFILGEIIIPNAIPTGKSNSAILSP